MGVPGLIKSYKYASESLLENVEYKKWVLLKKLSLKLNYKYHKMIDRIIYDYDGKILKSDFSDTISLYIEIPCKQFIDFKKEIIEKSNGTIQLIE